MLEVIKNLAIIVEYITLWVWFLTLNTWHTLISNMSLSCTVGSATLALVCVVIQIGEKLCL